jgi:hypothetical protein
MLLHHFPAVRVCLLLLPWLRTAGERQSGTEPEAGLGQAGEFRQAATVVPARASLAPFPHPYQIAGRRDVARLMVAHERAESFGELVLRQPGACPGLLQVRVGRLPGHNLISITRSMSVPRASIRACHVILSGFLLPNPGRAR